MTETEWDTFLARLEDLKEMKGLKKRKFQAARRRGGRGQIQETKPHRHQVGDPPSGQRVKADVPSAGRQAADLHPSRCDHLKAPARVGPRRRKQGERRAG